MDDLTKLTSIDTAAVVFWLTFLGALGFGLGRALAGWLIKELGSWCKAVNKVWATIIGPAKKSKFFADLKARTGTVER